MKILVTGHKGFIGSYLTPALKKAGHKVVGMDLKDGQDILDSPLPKVDAVIHLAAQPGVIKSIEDPVNTVKQNVLGTVRLAHRYKNTRFLFASTGGAIQDTIESPYGLSKYCCEEFIKMLCKDYVILRFANIYGKGSRSVADKFLQGDIHIYGDGSATRTYLYVEDLVRGIIQALEWPRGLYKFGSDQTYTVKQIAKAIRKPIEIHPWRTGELKKSSLENTTPDWEATVDLMDYIKENRLHINNHTISMKGNVCTI